MQRIKQIFTFGFLILAFSSFTGITDDISAALKAGNAFKLSAFFHEEVDVTILEKSDLMSKLEAEKLIYDFFHENKPSNFEIRHQGESKSGKTYTIGKLTTNNGTFRVSIYISKTNNSEYIQQIMIDAE
jgi:hypothetical protein